VRVRGAELRRCAAPLLAPVRNARTEWRRRESVLLRVYDWEGRVGRGEASPLPGYSRDSLEDCASALGSFPWSDLPVIEEPAQATEVALRLGAHLPAARFAAETALFDLLGQATDQSLPRLLGAPADSRVPLCALLRSETVAAQAAEVSDYERQGIHCFKRKLLGTNSSGPRQGLYPESGLLVALRRQAPRAGIRVDANRALPREEIPATLRALSEILPEWVEEPAAALEDLAESPVPLAFDESLQDPGNWDRVFELLATQGRGTVVLKPMALGGHGPCMALAKRAHAAGLRASVSHLFDGPIALASAAALALALPGTRVAAGLAPHPGLSAWPDTTMHFVRAGELIPWDVPGLGLGEVEPQ
jgi:o-succinylbenzoate synthase